MWSKIVPTKAPRILIAVVSVLIAAPAASASRPSATLDLPYLNAPAANAPLRDIPRLSVGAGGPLRPAVVDTGSTGVVLSASAIPDLSHLPDSGPGEITYSSSGRIMRGRWVTTPITIAGRTGRVVTRPIQILAVEAIACTPDARRCRPETNPDHVAMLGIGFDRAQDHQPGATPDRNPLLNVASPGGLPRSYEMSTQGIALGASGTGFSAIKLARHPDGSDWIAPAACIALDNGSPSCGRMLVDTGITGMFLTLPRDRLPRGSEQTLAAGTVITIDLSPPPADGRLRYRVTVGDPNDDVAPSSVALAGIGTRATFVNTGVHLLNRFDYRFDADAGTIGFRPR